MLNVRSSSKNHPSVRHASADADVYWDVDLSKAEIISPNNIL
jgi:hypothetical protein